MTVIAFYCQKVFECVEAKSESPIDTDASIMHTCKI